MADMYAVQSDTEAGAVAALQRMCAALGLEPVGPPLELPGRPRWMARAEAVPDRPQE